MKAIVFSNNSPTNLRNFLESASNKNVNNFEFSVLYNSDENHEGDYQKVFLEYGIINFKKIDSFKENLLDMIASASGLVSFFKDTNYFFSEIPELDFDEIMSDQDIFCFSLILGKNIKHCYYNDVYNILLNEEQIGDKAIKWNWVKHYLDFGRPLELGGGHIFRSKEIYKLFKHWKFTNIIELEACFEQLEYFPRELMASFNNSVLVDVLQVTEGGYETIKAYDFNSLDRIVLEI